MATRIAPSPAQAAAADNRSRIRAIVASSSGNLVEWYDFFVYSFTSLYFAAQFFPKGDQTTQLLNTAAVFALGFLVRPFGGYMFGRIADRYGRRTSMVISVTMMGVGSFAVAVLPTYASIGILAPALLLICRLIQGVSVGGEYGAVATYMSEVALAGKRGFYASFQYVTLIGGQLLAIVILVILQQFLTDDQMRAWGWRIPFGLGGVAALVALYLRRSLHETTTAETRSRREAGSIFALWKQHRRALLIVMGFTLGGSLSFYTYTTYMQKYLVNTAGLTAKTASYVMTAALFVFMVVQPLFGMLSDKIGRRNSMRLFGLGAAVGTVPLLTTIGGVQSPGVAFALVTMALMLISPYTSVAGIVKAEMFPVEVRAMGVGFPYAVANALAGGTAEYVALKLKSIGHETWFYWYVTAFLLLAFVVAQIMPDARKKGYLQGQSMVN